jgi:hypothetical protein
MQAGFLPSMKTFSQGKRMKILLLILGFWQEGCLLPCGCNGVNRDNL